MPLRAEVFETSEYRQFLHSGGLALPDFILPSDGPDHGGAAVRSLGTRKAAAVARLR